MVGVNAAELRGLKGCRLSLENTVMRLSGDSKKCVSVYVCAHLVHYEYQNIRPTINVRTFV